MSTQTDSVRAVEMACVETQTFAAQLLPPRHRASRTLQRNAFRAPVILRTSRLINPSFVETPKDLMKLLVSELMMSLNPRGKGCCYWHIAQQVLLHAITEMNMLECKQDFKPYSGWQCRRCLIIHEEDEEDDFDGGVRIRECSYCSATETIGLPRQIAREGSYKLSLIPWGLHPSRPLRTVGLEASLYLTNDGNLLSATWSTFFGLQSGFVRNGASDVRRT